MNPKLLLFFTWLFFVLGRHTADHIWLICMTYSAVLSVCAFFYQKEHSRAVAEAKKKA